MLQIADLLTLADAYEDAAGVGDTTLSFRVFADSKKLAALRVGKGIEVKRFNSALAWFSRNWPKDADWPESIERPGRVPSHEPQGQDAA